MFLDSPEFDAFFPLKAIVEKFPDLISAQGTETDKEEVRDDTTKNNPIDIVLNFAAQNSDDQIANIAQVASAHVPDQDDPEKYVNADKETIGRVIKKPFYYIDTSVFKMRQQ